MGRTGKKLACVAICVAALLILGGTARAPQATAAEGHQINGVPLYGQQHNLSCEYAAARMVTAYWGNDVSENEFINNIPFDANPHLGFRGDIDGPAGWVDDYGIYAEPIARYLQTQGFATRVSYDGAATLKAAIDAGHPIIVWVTMGLEAETPIKRDINGATVTLVPEEHAVVVTGYDADNVYVNGPAFGTYASFDWPSFLRSWGYFDNMALTIWPASASTGADAVSINDADITYRSGVS